MRKPIVDTYFEQSSFIDESKPVRVYRNLHTGLWSVKQGVVKFHTSFISLRNVQFCVNEKNRQKVLRERRKNVHAYVQGYLSGDGVIVRAKPIHYNPYKYDSFMSEDNRVCSALHCIMYKDQSGKMIVLAGDVLTKDTEQSIISTVPTHLL